jgi:hypothetical protein
MSKNQGITMLLYVVYDKDQKTLSTPLLAPTQEIAQTSLNQLNPENLQSLIIYPLAILNSPLDLFLISIDENKALPEFLINTSDDNIVEDTNEVRESSTL